jgi:hypothetical protein
MTDPTTEDARPATTDEAAAIVRDDPALQKATDTADDDAATDDDARTADAAPTGESRD